ncbi:MAG TPA: CHASE2 domain-containing protein [Thermoanaerobaculia bacterium]
MEFLNATWDARAFQSKVRDRSYWLRVLLLIVLGMVVARWLETLDWWRAATYRTYGALLRISQSPPEYPSWTAVVLIDDEDYWRGAWARRSPIKRSTLATLIEQINRASPRVIAIDIDLRAHVPDGSILTHPDYDRETKYLFGVIARVAQTTPIVLPKTVGFDERARSFVVDADLFDQVPLGQKVAAGYTRVPADLRNLALPTTVNGQRIKSLAAAAAAFVEPESVAVAQRRGGDELPFSMFLPEAAYARVTVRARDVLAGDAAALRALQHRVVVVGGQWHREAYGRGPLVDHHLTPVGLLPGAIIHANYIEALLAQRSFSPSFHWVHYGLDVLVGVALAVIFVAVRGPWKVLYIVVLALVVAVISVAAFQNLGTFFDGVPALVLLGCHAAVETMTEWKRAYDEHEHCPSRKLEATE